MGAGCPTLAASWKEMQIQIGELSMNVKSMLVMALCLAVCLMASAPMAHADDMLAQDPLELDWLNMWNFWAQFELRVAEYLIGGPVYPPVLNITAE